MEKTTVRRKATEGVGSGAGKTAILWVYPHLSGRFSVLAQGRTSIGRDFACDIRLPGDETSRQHAEIIREAALFVIKDLESTNGVYVDGKKVKRGPLDRGSVIRIGDWVGVVVTVSADQPDEGPAFEEIAPGYFGGPATRASLAALREGARSELPVVVQGQTGTGKEGVARAAHLWSGRSGPFIAVNCAALPESLAEAELFGFRKGAFTNADRSSSGYFQAANRGTLFLDELTELPMAIQAKLLRALEQKEVLPIGEAKPVPVDVRFVAATQIPLGQAVVAQRFREDLLARLDGLYVELLPLRSRVEEVPFLFTNLLRAHAGGREPPQIDAAVVESLCCYEWPLNVRELTNVAKKIVALHGNEETLKRAQVVSLLGSALKGATREVLASARSRDLGAGEAGPESSDVMPPPFGAAPVGLTRDQQDERRRIIEVMNECVGSQTAAAKALGMSRGTLIERIKKYGIPRPRA